MKHFHISNFTKGWVIGDFKPTIKNTKDFEIALKSYKKGEYEQSHFHKISTEITIICSGKVEMNGVKYISGDIILIEPNESTDFKVMEDTITTVIKIPSSTSDKYFLNK